MNENQGILALKTIEKRIFTFRGVQVMIDRDLAEMYHVATKVLNQAVKRNKDRFPAQFHFQLSDKEKFELVTNCDRFNGLKHASVNPYAFIEQGVAMLSAILRSETAIKVSIRIMEAFVEMRKMVLGNAALFQRLDRIELKQLEADDKFDQVFKALEARNRLPEKGVFYDGQVFEAWNFVSDLIRKAKTSILLIDNYVDDSVLALFTKRNKGVDVTILTKTISKALAADLKKYNAQYEPIEIREFSLSHDRFLLIDGHELFHIGASLKDLGKKWFAFSRMDIDTLEMIEKLEKKKQEIQ